MTAGTTTADSVREKALFDYKKKLLEHKEVESRLKESEYHWKNDAALNVCFPIICVFVL